MVAQFYRFSSLAAVLLTTTVGCSLDPNAGGVKVRLDVEARSESSQARMLAQAMVGSGNLTVDSFDCLLVDISGPGIQMMADPRPAGVGAASRALASLHTLEGAPKAPPAGRRRLTPGSMGWGAQESSGSLSLHGARVNGMEAASAGPSACRFPSITSQIVSADEGGEILLRVPAGMQRTVRVIGLATPEGGCPYAGQDYMDVVGPYVQQGLPSPFEEAVLGSTETSFFADSTVYVQNQFDPLNWESAFGCDLEGGHGPAYLVATTSTLHTTCVSPGNGMVKCWGDGTMGQLGNGTTTTDYSQGQQVEVSPGVPLSNVVDLKGGASHFCALTQTGQLFCWGNNSSGQLGDGTTTNRSRAILTSIATAGSEGVWDFGLGRDHTCASDFYENLFCWGDNTFGQLGVGDNTSRSTATRSPDAGTTFTSIDQTALGGDTSCIIDAGFVSCWGYDQNGALGNGVTGDVSWSDPLVYIDPSDFPGFLGDEKIVQMSVGSYGTVCAVSNYGSVYCWGSGTSGQMGDTSVGTSNQLPVATYLDGSPGNQAWKVAVGSDHVCALRLSDPEDFLMCWGNGGAGQLANGGGGSNIPITANGANRFLSMSMGNAWGCAATAQGGYFCWGANAMGQLGTGDTAGPVNSPQQVSISF